MTPAQALNLINRRIRELAAYHLEREDTEVKLNQNENPFDWPADIKNAAADFCRQRPWNRYPPFIPEELKEMLGAYAGLGGSNVMVGNGSNEMLLVLLLSLVDRGGKVILCQPTFTVYRLLTRGLGGEEVTVSARSDLSIDAGAITEAAKANPRSLLILTSPNNPTGSSLSEAEIRSVLDVHSGFCILDQAYVEFGGYSAVPLIGSYPNLIITRTFSKAFAGAGLRLGYMLGSPEIIMELSKIKLPYNINFFSDYVARLLLSQRPLINEQVRGIIAERDLLYAALRKLPFDACYPSAANFVLVRCGKKQELFDHLKRDGILVRDVSTYPQLENCLRISVGSPEENTRLIASAGRFFGNGGKR